MDQKKAFCCEFTLSRERFSEYCAVLHDVHCERVLGTTGATPVGVVLPAVLPTLQQLLNREPELTGTLHCRVGSPEPLQVHTRGNERPEFRCNVRVTLTACSCSRADCVSCTGTRYVLDFVVNGRSIDEWRVFSAEVVENSEVTSVET